MVLFGMEFLMSYIQQQFNNWTVIEVNCNKTQ